MSGFRRTSSGLNNQHLFHNVDLIVFLEGGTQSYTLDQVMQYHFSEDTEDVLFWKRIFNRFGGTQRVKFKSIGSKSVVKEIAVDILDGKLTTVLVAMDNEFDEVLERRLDHPNIYYTNGYSWENDVWNHDVIKAVIEELSAVDIEGGEIETCFNEFVSKIKLAVYADAYLFKDGGSFFPRNKGHLFCVDCKPVDLPIIKESEIAKKIMDKGISKRKANLFGNKRSLDPLKFCYGHFLADYCCQYVHHYLRKRLSLSTVSNDIIKRMGIRKRFELGFTSVTIDQYYIDQFARRTI